MEGRALILVGAVHVYFFLLDDAEDFAGLALAGMNQHLDRFLHFGAPLDHFHLEVAVAIVAGTKAGMWGASMSIIAG
jgi:hypothetical protein